MFVVVQVPAIEYASEGQTTIAKVRGGAYNNNAVARRRYAGGSGTEHPIRDGPFRGVLKPNSHGKMSLPPRQRHTCGLFGHADRSDRLQPRPVLGDRR